MGAAEYIAQRSDKITQGKADTLDTIGEFHVLQRQVLALRQIVQVERLKEPNASLSVAMAGNVGAIEQLEEAFDSVVDSVEKMPAAFLAVEAAEARLEAAMPSTEPPSS